MSPREGEKRIFRLVEVIEALLAQSVVSILKQDKIWSAKLALPVGPSFILAQYANEAPSLDETRTPYTTQYLREPV